MVHLNQKLDPFFSSSLHASSMEQLPPPVAGRSRNTEYSVESRRFFWNMLDAERTVNYDIHITILVSSELFHLLLIIYDS